jgi:hypothetical protein
MRKIVLLLLLALVLGVIYALLGGVKSQPAQISDIAIEKPNIVVHGLNLGKVEVWAIPTGTNITENDYQLLGVAALSSTDPGGVQAWALPIPAQPVLATEIFAKGFDVKGSEIGRVALPQTGATELSDALWGTGATSTIVATSTEATLGVGDTGVFGNLKITFNSLVQDVRCASDDPNCPEAGAVNVNVTLQANGKEETRNLASDEVPYSFHGYDISIAGVAPPRLQNTEIPKNAYKITVHVVR